MGNEIAAGKRVLFRAEEGDAQLTPGIVEDLLPIASDPGNPWMALILSAKGTFERPVSQVKLGTQDTDPAAWMLHDGKTSTPVVYLDSCYICVDPEFAQMGLPLCRPCPDCKRDGRGLGHIAADDTKCHYCGYEDGPDDYPD